MKTQSFITLLVILNINYIPVQSVNSTDILNELSNNLTTVISDLKHTIFNIGTKIDSIEFNTKLDVLSSNLNTISSSLDTISLNIKNVNITTISNSINALSDTLNELNDIDILNITNNNIKNIVSIFEKTSDNLSNIHKLINSTSIFSFKYDIQSILITISLFTIACCILYLSFTVLYYICIKTLFRKDRISMNMGGESILLHQ